MRRIKGLGDIVELITRYTGIKWVVKKLFGEDCGCDERQEYLNKQVSFTKPDIDITQPQMPPIPDSYTKNNGK